ncbi:MAG: hypothetical protein H6606_10745 [Flavobacteriales bacterium]|nr:hypothetical protein [Flavobacteriales bacterium]
MEIGLIRQVAVLFLKEVQIEWRNRFAINGIAVQLLSSVFICYLLFPHLELHTWNALFLLIMLFTITNAIARSFASESPGRMLYYHSISHPLALFFAKVLLNTLLAGSIAILGYITFSILLGPAAHEFVFTGILILFCVGCGLLLSAISAISAKSRGGNLLMPVLSFPLLIPLLLICVGAANRSLDPAYSDSLWTDLALLTLLNTLILVLVTLLYRFVWQE